MSRDLFHDFAAHLKRKCPTRRRVIIRRVAMGAHGSTSLTDDEQTITVCIRRGDSARTQIETLIHEWGHVLEYDRQGYHGDVWGAGNAAAYRAWLEWEQ